jgi:hypothetical protein
MYPDVAAAIELPLAFDQAELVFDLLASPRRCSERSSIQARVNNVRSSLTFTQSARESLFW